MDPLRHRVLLLATVVGLSACALDRSGLGGPLDDAGPFGPDASLDDAGTDAPDGPPPIDAGPLDGGPLDGGPPAGDTGPPPEDAGPACAAWMPRHFDPCVIGDPAPELVIRINSTYNTTRGVLSNAEGDQDLGVVIDQSGTPAQVVSVLGFRVEAGARLRVVGSMPLIVASWNDIRVDGTIDARSVSAATAGAGSNPSVCSAATPGEDGDSGTGGGGGGGFGGRGGTGGRGDGNGTERSGGAGAPAVAGPPTIVRGGCPGADSGAYMGSVGAGGAGGGAVQLTARGRIDVTGQMLAAGAGGRGGPDSTATGGGGGGSGGYLGLEGAQVVVEGVLAANGGGGGEGCNFSSTGADGANGRADTTRAAGGDGTGASGTAGGGGGAGSTPHGEDVTTIENGGGGGGGGGVGFVLAWTSDFMGSSAVISPDPIVSP